jgi:DNA-binding transcriptional MerR regulator
MARMAGRVAASGRRRAAAAGGRPVVHDLYANVNVRYHRRVTTGPTDTPARLLRIQEVAAEVGLTTRAVRYYEELGLLTPAARSGGAYRLYDASDVERLRSIKALRDDAGFSLAEVAQLLEDEAARQAARDRFRAAADPAERREIVVETLVRVDRQIATLRAKADRIEAMVADAETRRDHLRRHLADIDGGRNDRHGPATEAPGTTRP